MSLDDTLERATVATSGPAWAVLGQSPLLAGQSYFPAVASANGQLFAFAGDNALQLLSSPDGAAWSERPTGIPAREFPTGVLFKNQLWIVAGGAGDDGDTWASVDFDTWTRLSLSAEWAPRRSFALMPFGDSLYLAGGVQSDSILMGDVWVTRDGEWTLVNDKAFSPRVPAAWGVLGRQMALLGGNTAQGPLAEVLVSDDGSTWVSRAAPWPPRWSGNAVTIDETLYLIGGEGPQGVLRDVWCTRDLVNWAQVDGAAPPLVGAGVGAFADSLAMLGGKAGGQANSQAFGFNTLAPGWSKIGASPLAGLETSPVVVGFYRKTFAVCGHPAHNLLSSADGVVWRDEPTNLPFIAGAAGASQSGALWLSGGSLPPATACTSQVWTSTDGAQWTQTTPNAPWAARRGHCMADFKGRLWVIGGIDNAGKELADVWSSADGVTWQLEAASPFAPACYATAIVFSGRLWVLGGTDSTLQVRSTMDGKNWLASGAPFPWRLSPRVQQVGNALYLLGGDRGGGEVFTDVWSSANGRAWTQLETASPWRNGQGFGSTVVDDGVVVFGGKDAAGQSSADIWRYLAPG